MKQLDEKAKAIFDEASLWYMGTCSDTPEVTAIGFKEVMDDGRLFLCDVFMKETLENLKKNNRVVVTACVAEKMRGYEVYGTAEYVTEGETLAKWAEIASSMSGGKMAAKGAVIITPDRIRNMSANSHNGEEL